MKPPSKPYNFHPACLAFPLLADAELRELAEDIKLRGLLHPVVVFRGEVLDGRNRLAACEKAGIAPRFTEWSGGGSPVEWVISTNLHRRHLSASQRAVVALDILPLLEKEAKERQRLGPGRRVATNALTSMARRVKPPPGSPGRAAATSRRSRRSGPRHRN